VGRTWAKVGPGGSFEAKADSGIARGTRGLLLRMTGKDWRGCGLNWKGAADRPRIAASHGADPRIALEWAVAGVSCDAG
jgi:hypothetical protein